MHFARHEQRISPLCNVHVHSDTIVVPPQWSMQASGGSEGEPSLIMHWFLVWGAECSQGLSL